MPTVVTAVSKDDVLKTIANLKQILKFGHAVAGITPTTIDDKVLDIAEKVILMVEPFAGEDWFISGMSALIGLFESKKSSPGVPDVKVSFSK